MTQDFKRVSNNQEKGKAYKHQIERFNLAKEGGFYFECIFILYALMEDRLSSFLFHAGVTNKTRLGITTNKKVRPELEQIIKVDQENGYSLRNISDKIYLTRQILMWAKTCIVDDTSDCYPEILWGQIVRTQKMDQMIELMEDINHWRSARNDLVHALLNRNTKDMEVKLKTLTEEGERYWRGLNTFMNIFSRNNPIRKKFNIQ